MVSNRNLDQISTLDKSKLGNHSTFQNNWGKQECFRKSSFRQNR